MYAETGLNVSVSPWSLSGTGSALGGCSIIATSNKGVKWCLHGGVASYPFVSALGSTQLPHHPLLHPLAMSHDQFQHSQGVWAHRPALQVGVRLGEHVLALLGLAVPLQGEEWIAEVILAVTLLDKSISVLSLMNAQTYSTCVISSKEWAEDHMQ